MIFLNKPKVDVSLNIENKPYYPGETIVTRTSISSQERFKARSGRIELGCTEEYWIMVSSGKTTHPQKCKRKLFRLQEEFLTDTEFSSGMVLNERQNIVLPKNIPPTISGKTANISWQIDFKLDIPKTRDIHRKHTITVLPIATAIPTGNRKGAALSNRVTTSSEDGDLTLTLDPGYGATGEALGGTLEVMTKRDIGVEGVRVELEVKEKAGIMTTTTIADVIQTENATTLAGGSYNKWKFRLKVPGGRLPSCEISDSSVQWRVKGIIDRRLKKDFSVSFPITVF